MEAKARPFSFIEEVEILEIPFFQRSYVWERENWEELLSDLLKVGHNPFLGSLILKRVDRLSGDLRHALVIDGQQRLTTLSILLKALNDTYDEDLQEDVRRLLFFRKTSRSEERLPRLQHSRLDRESYCAIVNSRSNAEVPQNGDDRILACYRFFYERLMECPQADRDRLLDLLVNGRTNIWVVIDLDAKDNEQAIFDTINSAGVRLSYADTIKNSVFQDALRAAGEDRRADVINLYEQSWQNVFEADEESRNYWQHEAQAIRVKRTNLEIFLHSFAIVKGFYSPKDNSLEDLPDLYKAKTSDMGFAELTGFVREIARVARIYRERILVFDDSKLFSYADTAERVFHILDRCNVTTFHPYVLSLYANNEEKSDLIQNRLRELESFVIRQFVCRKSARQYNTYCAEFISDANAVERRNRETDAAEVRSHLRAIDNRQAALVLFWIELHRREADARESVKALKFDYSLEHVLPQKWKQNWSGVPVLNEEGNVVEDPVEGEKIRDQKLWEIGNMTLLNSRLNTAISNSAFEVKIAGLPADGRKRAKKGIRDYGDLKITKEDILRPYENGDHMWDEAHISRRTEALIQEFESLWGV